MIRIKRAHPGEIPPPCMFTGVAIFEMALAKRKNWEHVFKLGRCWEVWEDDRFLCLFGVIRFSLMSPVQFWFSAGVDLKKASKRAWRSLRRTARRLIRLFGRIEAYVQADFHAGCRMAEFFGFHDIGELDSARVYMACSQAQ